MCMNTVIVMVKLNALIVMDLIPRYVYDTEFRS